MKIILLCLFMMVNAFAMETSHFEILRGSLHKGGYLTATPTSVKNSDKIIIKMVYEIKAKNLVLVPKEYLKGTYNQELPSMFLDERGYLELEKKKSLKIRDAKIVYLGRVKLNGVNDAHRVKILADNKKSEIFLTYHPTFKGLGWDNIKLIIHTDLPLLGDYVIEGKLK